MSRLIATYVTGRIIERDYSASSRGLRLPPPDNWPIKIELWGADPSQIDYARRKVCPRIGEVVVHE